jgi:CRISPR/Cas system-associated exonuclease Cas4 (RecB family)
MAKRKIKLYQGKVTIFFDEERHQFSHEDGTPILGTTSVTGLIDKSAPLMAWATNNMALILNQNLEAGQVITPDHIDIAKREYRRLKKEAADIGSLIHEWAEKWITIKKKPEIPEDEKVRNGVIAFLKWVKDTGVEFNNSELVVYSKKHDVAGIMDADGRIGKKDCIIDFKSSKAIYNEMLYQLASYWMAREEETKKEYEIGYIVRFGKEDGEFGVTEISRKEYMKNREAFLGMLKVKRRECELRQ